MNIRKFNIEEDTFYKNAHGISKYYLEVLLLLRFLQTKLQTRNMNKKYYDS